MTGRVVTARAVQAAFDVSRETLERLRGLPRRCCAVEPADQPGVPGAAWPTPGIGTSPIRRSSGRCDPPGPRLWLDLGSGAGFPGLVIAALAAEQAPGLRVALVESDARKAAFLRRSPRRRGPGVSMLHCDAIEDACRRRPRISSRLARSRRWTSLLGICGKTSPAPGVLACFRRARRCITRSPTPRARWRFDHRLHPSRTEPEAAIVEIGAIARV